MPSPAERPVMDPADPGALVGSVLAGRYEVTGLLGTGGIGRVYRARHRGLDREVAVKVLLEHYQAMPSLQRRFEREARALAALSHPNIVTITDFVAAAGTSFLVMELVEGEELSKLIERGPLPPAQAFSLMEQMLSSLAYAHERDVIHRDLKPQNVIVRTLPGGKLHAEVLDFGLAKFLDGSGPDANLTKTGLVVGTPAYMAPEQASGGRVDQRADVYAAGHILAELLTGTHPFEGSEGTELLRRHLLEAPPTLASLATGAQVAPELERLFERALAKDGHDRFADAGAMLDAFLALPPNAFRPPEGQAVAISDARAEAPTVLAASSPSTVTKGGGRLRGAIFGGAAALGVVALAVVAWSGIGAPGGLIAGEEVAASAGPTEVEAAPPGAEDEPSEAVPSADEITETEPSGEEAVADDEPADEDEPTGDDDALEDEEEELAAPVVRPPARNPWRAAAPQPLSRLRRRLEAGHTMQRGHLREIIRYRRNHPNDPRANLLLGQIYAGKGWLTHSVNTYRRAYRRDPSVRGDPRMRRDLVRAAGTESVHELATEAVVEIYGAELLPALARAIATERDEAVKGRLEATRAALR